MFKCKCKSEHAMIENRIDALETALERRMTARIDYINKILYGIIDYLDIELVRTHEKIQIPEVQFRKRKQVKQEK